MKHEFVSTARPRPLEPAPDVCPKCGGGLPACSQCRRKCVMSNDNIMMMTISGADANAFLDNFAKIAAQLGFFRPQAPASENTVAEHGRGGVDALRKILDEFKKDWAHIAARISTWLNS